MSFLPGDVLASAMRFYELQALGLDLHARLDPLGLKAEVTHDAQAPLLYLAIPLPAGGKVMLFFDSRGAWSVARPLGPHEPGELTAWPLETPPATLLDIAAEAARASIERRSLLSPYCWGRAEHSVITGLADTLVALGVPAGDIQVPRALTPDIEGNKLVRDSGHSERLVLQEETEAAQVEVALRPGLGWTADLEVHDDLGSRGRMDLRFASYHVREPRPDMPLGELPVDDLAGLLLEWWAADGGTSNKWGRLWRYAPTPRWSYFYVGELDDHQALSSWFHWCGFTDVQPQKAGKSVQLSGKHLLVHLHSAASSAGLSVVQRVQGQASVTASRAAVISPAGFTRQARRWADDAGVALFGLDGGSVPRPGNEAAAHLMPEPGKLLPSDCTGSACKFVGCVLDSSVGCPTDIGREWSDPHSYLWRQVEPPSQ
ncbi:hypothetical protein ACI784_09140 [Geodermatophilus sp. SYSU D01186]